MFLVVIINILKIPKYSTVQFSNLYVVRFMVSYLQSGLFLFKILREHLEGVYEKPDRAGFL